MHPSARGRRRELAPPQLSGCRNYGADAGGGPPTPVPGQNYSVGRTATETARLVNLVAWFATAAWSMGGCDVGG